MIVRNGKKIVDVFRNGKYIQKAYIGDKLVFQKKGSDQPTEVPAFISTYFLDQSISDPAQMMAGTKELGKDGTPETNIVSWIRANSHRYVGNYDAERGMVLRQLDDNDSTKYADGSDASVDITGTNGGDVFMKMPDFWFIGESLDNNNFKYNIHFSAVEPTDGKNWTKWDGNTLIGVYKALRSDTTSNAKGDVRSVSGFTPTVNSSQDTFKKRARSRSNGDDHFMIVTNEAHQATGLLYMCYYGNMDGQAIIGKGTYSHPKVTGATNVDGMNDTVAENSRSINFWGLENWWGDNNEYIDNLLTQDASSGIVNILDYNGNVVRRFIAISDYGNIHRMSLGDKLDLIPSDTDPDDASYATYYCDAGANNPFSPEVIGLRSSRANIVAGGPFNLNIQFHSTYTSSDNTSRLQYQGRVVIDNGPKAISARMKAKSANAFNPIDLQYVYVNGKEVLRTGFDFHICNMTDFGEVKFKLYGKNINYKDIVFDADAVVDSDGNVTVNDCRDEMQITMTYQDNLIGVVCLHSISEEEVIEIEREKHIAFDHAIADEQ